MQLGEDPVRKPNIDMAIIKDRLERIRPMFEDSALVLFSHPDYVRNNDVHHEYRQDTNFYYLTGFEEPGAIFVWRPGQTPETVLFVRPKDPKMETWEGFRYGVQLTPSTFQVDACFETEAFAEQAPGLFKDVRTVFHRMYAHPENDRLIEEALKSTKALTRRSGNGYLSIKDPSPVLGDFRLIKEDNEVQLMRKACEISAQAHVELMRAVRPGMNERELQGIFIKEIMARGAARQGYPCIVAGGDNATTLHYVFNDQPLKDGDLVLVDAGAEFNYYTGDITRMFPVSGKFTEPQKRVYNKVLDVQKKLVAMIKPGVTLKQVSRHAIQLLSQVMIDENLVSGSLDDVIAEEKYKKYFMHGFGHWLGMDVHDAGRTNENGQSRTLEAGMCLTVEPGIYIPANDETAPEELRGLGIRIEDDILVTQFGNENMTEGVPKDVDEIEALMANKVL